MGESGCLKDGHFQNLQVEGNTILGGAATDIVTVTGIIKNGYSAIYTGTRTADANLVLTGATDGTNSAISGNAGTFPAGSLVLLNNNANHARTITVALPAGGTSTKGVWYHFSITVVAQHNSADIIIDANGSNKISGPIMAGTTAVSENCVNIGVITFDASGNSNAGKATMLGAFIKIMGTGETGNNAWIVQILSPLTNHAGEITVA